MSALQSPRQRRVRSSVGCGFMVEDATISSNRPLRRQGRVGVPLEAIPKPLPLLAPEHGVVFKFRSAPVPPLGRVAVLRVGLHFEADLLVVLEVVSSHRGDRR